MTSSRWLVLALVPLLLLCGVTRGAAQQRGTASLRGMVISGDDGQTPIRRAIVTITGPGIARNLSTVTDDGGAFSFVNLAAGRYELTASKVAYLTSAYGAVRPGKPGTPIVLANGATISDLRLALRRGAVVTGVLRDLNGVPAPNVQIAVVRAAEAQSAARFSASMDGSLLTDDRGIYRAYGLAPGEYVVAASGLVPRTATLARTSDALVDAALGALDARTRMGRAAVPSAALAEPLTFGPVFYPGTSAPEGATRIRLGYGEIKEGVDFTYAPIANHRVAGRVVMADGTPLPPVQLSLRAIGPSLPVVSVANLFGSTPDANGEFSYSNVGPGRYVVVAKQTGLAPVDETRPVAPLADPDIGPGSVILMGTTEVTVTGADQLGVTVTMRPSAAVKGQVRFEDTDGLPAGVADSLSVTLRPARVAASALTPALAAQALLPDPTPGPLRSDGTFLVANVAPGRYTVTTSMPESSEWWLRSAIVGGRDALDQPLDVLPDAPPSGEAVLTFSKRRSGLTGALQTPGGRPAPDYVVVVMPADRALWESPRRVQSAKPGSDGRFAFRQLPPGEYLIAALTDVEDGDLLDVSMLEAIASAGVAVRVAEGQIATQDLQLR
jgi:hypothetical protein